MIGALSLAACTVVSVEGSDGSKSTTIGLGVTPDLACDADKALVADVRGLGVWAEGSGGGGLGYRSARYYCGSPECRVIIWADDGVDAEALRREFNGFDTVCVVDGGGRGL